MGASFGNVYFVRKNLFELLYYYNAHFLSGQPEKYEESDSSLTRLRDLDSRVLAEPHPPPPNRY
jgi:hypothetical protein